MFWKTNQQWSHTEGRIVCVLFVRSRFQMMSNPDGWAAGPGGFISVKVRPSPATSSPDQFLGRMVDWIEIGRMF